LPPISPCRQAIAPPASIISRRFFLSAALPGKRIVFLVGIGLGLGTGVGTGLGLGFGDGVGLGFGDGAGLGFGDGAGLGFGDGVGLGFGDGAGLGFGDGAMLLLAFALVGIIRLIGIDPATETGCEGSPDDGDINELGVTLAISEGLAMLGAAILALNAGDNFPTIEAGIFIATDG